MGRERRREYNATNCRGRDEPRAWELSAKHLLNGCDDFADIDVACGMQSVRDTKLRDREKSARKEPARQVTQRKVQERKQEPKEKSQKQLEPERG